MLAKKCSHTMKHRIQFHCNLRKFICTFPKVVIIQCIEAVLNCHNLSPGYGHQLTVINIGTFHFLLRFLYDGLHMP